jgi:acetate kinase
MKILVLNSGSSSIKYSFFEMSEVRVLASGIIERIGESQSVHRYQLLASDGSLQETIVEQAVAGHRQGLADIIRILQDCGMLKHAKDLSGIGHRVVHGGEMFHEPTLINDAVLANIREMIPLAPLHNPANLMGIEVTLQFAAGVPQVAVFDTAFHQSMPAHAFHYALPRELYEQERIRRYGFHGTSHYYVAKQASEFLNKPLHALNMITLHLGNGASATAIRHGKSVDTSMGMTPLEGLVMGTRSGDIDPAIPFYLNQHRAMSSEETDIMLNKESGMKGICGENDMRAVHRLAEAGDENARLALEMYYYRIKKYIGAYCAVLGRVDAIVFTGGIGENDVQLREKVCANLSILGIAIDLKKNVQCKTKAIDIRKQGSPVAVLVIATNEELEIAMQTIQCIQG